MYLDLDVVTNNSTLIDIDMAQLQEHTPVPSTRSSPLMPRQILPATNPSPTPSICSKTRSHIENTIVPIGKFAGLLCTFHRNNRRCDLCCRDDRENHNVEKNSKVSICYTIYPNHKIQKLDQWLGIIIISFKNYC